jgi:triosephosphate isomerase
MGAGRTRNPLIAGNWKMNGLRAALAELRAMADGAAGLPPHVECMICPPATLLAQGAAAMTGTRIAIGAQDCHPEPNGAFTGDIAAEMIADAGGSAVIVGHSERRTVHKETDELVRSKAQAAWRAGLIAIVCVGETQAEREAGRTLAVIATQLKGSLPQGAEDGARAGNLVVAYEPVWAIGTGLTPTVADVAEVHRAIRAHLRGAYPGEGEGVRILYGGSVKPSNAAELLAVEDVDGALVGGASLKAADFLGIARACT